MGRFIMARTVGHYGHRIKDACTAECQGLAAGFVCTLPGMRILPVLPLFALAVVLAGCAPQPTEPAQVPSMAYEGLEPVSSRYFDLAYVRPGVQFDRYRQVVINAPELAFRTPDRSRQQFPLSEEQRTRFRDMLRAQFDAELARSAELGIAAAAGADVLDLHVRVQDILATVPPRTVGQGGRGGFALQALGEATLVIELRDAESGEVLARVFDRRAVQGVGMFQQDALVTRWEDVEELCRHWARTVRERLDAVVTGSY